MAVYTTNISQVLDSFYLLKKRYQKKRGGKKPKPLANHILFLRSKKKIKNKKKQ